LQQLLPKTTPTTRTPDKVIRRASLTYTQHRHFLKWYARTLLKNPRTLFQKKLKVDLNRSTIWDLKEAKEDKKSFGQVVTPPLPFPLLYKVKDLNGNSLDMTQKKFLIAPLNLILVSQKSPWSRLQCDSWKKPFKAKFPLMDTFELYLVENHLYRIFGPYFRYKMRRQVEIADFTRILHYGGTINHLELSINIENSFLAHVFLVDGNYNIRWKAIGLPANKELTQLFAFTETLLQQHQSVQKKRGYVSFRASL